MTAHLTEAERRVIHYACKFIAANTTPGIRSLRWKLKLTKAVREYREEQRAERAERAVEAARRVA